MTTKPSTATLRVQEDAAAVCRAIRDRLGLSQEEIARRCGVSCGTAYNWCHGKQKPTKYKAVKALARLLRQAEGQKTQDNAPVERPLSPTPWEGRQQLAEKGRKQGEL